MISEFHPRLKSMPFGAVAIGVFVLLMVMAVPNRATAQLRMSQVPEHLVEEQTANLYVDVAGSESFDGVLVAIPASWKLISARFVNERGHPYQTSLTEIEEYSNRILIRPDSPISRSDRLILTVRSTSVSAGSSLSVTPIRLTPGRFQRAPKVLESYRLRADLPVVQAWPQGGGLAASFHASSNAGPTVPGDRLPSFGSDDPFTLETWIRTTDLEQIVLSTWDGDEETPYPIELVIDGAGHVVSYQGTAGYHVSMRSEFPLADGFWHHVAIAHDPAEGWTRMFMDGTATDSLRHTTSMDFSHPRGLRLGRRLVTTDGLETLSDYTFSGQMDELRFWAEARSADVIERNRHRQLNSAGTKPLVLTFDDSDQLAQELGVPTAPSTLSTARPIVDLNVRAGPSGVFLSWSAPDPSVDDFIVESSPDGTRYREISRIETSTPAGTDNFSYLDEAAGEGVRYYRIREVLDDDTERVSTPVKVGLGSGEEETTAVLAGNFPNPFNPSTQVSFMIRETQHVRVSVWDLAGQLVSVLVDETVSPGYHEVRFDAEGLPSGTYFARMQTAEGIQTRQMVLMK